jgi:hypothetical protein
MDLQLTAEEATELRNVLIAAISDLSPEIADTDNPSYRAMLRHRRDVLRGIGGQLAE